MRFVVDMNLTPRWVPHLRDAGHEAVHWSEIGNPEAPDGEICAYSRDNGYIVVTNDLDFPHILAYTGERGPSVVLLRGEPLVPEVSGSSLLQALLVCEPELSSGAIVSLVPGCSPLGSHPKKVTPNSAKLTPCDSSSPPSS
jgi:predicted nuclease of predicted toxin-antitoxin system